MMTETEMQDAATADWFLMMSDPEASQLVQQLTPAEQRMACAAFMLGWKYGLNRREG